MPYSILKLKRIDMRHTLAILTAGLSAMPAVADAQSIIMRKPIGGAVFSSGPGGYQQPPRGTTPGPVGTPTPTATPAPVPAPAVGSWTVSQPRPMVPACSATAPARRDVVCMSAEGARLPDSACSTQGEKPAETVTVADYSGCGSAWTLGSYGSWTSTCSDAAFRTRPVTCTNTGSGALLDDASCTDPRPSATEGPKAQTTSCRYAWQYGDWTSASQCSGSTTQTRTARCATRTDEGTQIVDAGGTQCAAQQEALTRSAQEDYTGCGYAWKELQSGQYSSMCANAAYYVYDVQCVRKDGNDTVMTGSDQARCTATRPTPRNGPYAMYQGCSSIVPDGGVNSGTSGWSFTAAGSDYAGRDATGAATYSGSAGVIVRWRTAGSSPSATLSVGTVPGRRYVVGLWVRGNVNYGMAVSMPGTSTLLKPSVPSSQYGWGYWGLSFVASGSTSQIAFSASTKGNDVYVDEVLVANDPG